MSIIDVISDRELNDLRHKHRADPEWTRVLNCLANTRDDLAKGVAAEDEREIDKKIDKLALEFSGHVQFGITESINRAVKALFPNRSKS
jgi:hypothetical protein